MPALLGSLSGSAGAAPATLDSNVAGRSPNPTINTPTLVERVNIPFSVSAAPEGLIQAETVDPFSQSGKYALGWTYFCVVILAIAFGMRLYNLWTDKIRTAMFKDRFNEDPYYRFETPYEMSQIQTDRSTNKLFPRHEDVEAVDEKRLESSISSIKPVHKMVAMLRFIFYRPTPIFKVKHNWRPIAFPSLAVMLICFGALTFVTLYTFIQQPLYWEKITYGSPPVAIRSGMMAVAMMPWLIGLSMKANLISLMTGIGHERLNVLHRWGGWLCLFLALIHTVPFYIQHVPQDQEGHRIFRTLFQLNRGIYIYGTGWAALAPLLFLCFHSIPRHWMYEVFIATHIPASVAFLGFMFWHCNNYLTSWNYLWATMAIWALALIYRMFFLNWTNFLRMSWLCGEEASVILLHENAIKVTIPTQVRWRPGQYIYLRMPGISVFENHPFTIASLCSDDFASEYGEDYRDMVIVFRPFGGFTKRMLDSALEKGPYHSYRAFIDGPYGGMSRSLDAFDHVVLVAGGSGITALVSHLLDLIKRMRDGKAVTKSIRVIWALKRPEIMEWFKEELKICREFAPPDSIQFQFFITTAKRVDASGQLVSAQTPSRPMSAFFHNKVNDTFQEIANKRASHHSEYSRHSALIREEAAGNPELEKELRRENEDAITALPRAHVVPADYSTDPQLGPQMPVRSVQDKRKPRNLSLDIKGAMEEPPPTQKRPDSFNFGFPSTPTEFQKNLMRFAFLSPVKKKDGWTTEYGRPDLPYMLGQMSKDFDKRTCVFVCGPPGMRMDVSRTVAKLQTKVLSSSQCDEIHLHTENYAI